MAHRFSSMKSVLSTLMDGSDGQKAGVSQSTVPSWGQKPRAQDQGWHRSQGMGQSPTGQFLFFFGMETPLQSGHGALWEKAKRQ